MSIEDLFSEINIVQNIPETKKIERHYNIFSSGGRPFTQSISSYANFRKEIQTQMRTINPKCDICVFTNPPLPHREFYVKFKRYPLPKTI